MHPFLSASRRKTSFLFFLIVLISSAYAQNTTVDSLLQIIEKKKATSETYNQLAYAHWFIDMNKSGEFAAQALKLAREEKDSAQIAFAFNRIGTVFLYSEQLDSALGYYKQSALLFEKLKMNTELGGATACCAKTYEYKFEYEKAIEEYIKSLEIFEKTGVAEYYVQTLIVVGNLYAKLDEFRNALQYYLKAEENKSYINDYDLVMLYNSIGTNYQNMGDYRNAIKYFEQAFQKCDPENSTIALAKTYVNIGNLYIAWNKNEAALDYLEKGLECSKAIGFEQIHRTILTLIAEIYFEAGNFNEAKNYYTRALEIPDGIQDKYNEARAYNGLAKISGRELNYKGAIAYALKALDLFEETERPFYIAYTHYILAENYFHTSYTAKAKEHLDRASAIADKNSLKELKAEISLLQARYNTVVNKGTDSERYYEEYIALKNSLFEEQNQELLARFQVELDNLEKDFQLKEAQNLNQIKEIELSEKKKQLFFIVVIALLLLLSAFVFAIMYVRKQKANRVLFLKNKELLERESKNQKKNEGVEIQESLQNEIIQRLEKQQNENRVHLRNDITLHSLSKLLETNSSYLSRIIQLNYNTNFSAYLNKCRVLEAQKMILDKNFSHYTIDAISQECGYNSKSTFNKAFKEFTGLTPKEYKRQDAL